MPVLPNLDKHASHAACLEGDFSFLLERRLTGEVFVIKHK